MMRPITIPPRVHALATATLAVAYFTACASGDNAGGMTATITQGPVAVAAQSGVRGGAVVAWGDTQIDNPFDYGVRVVAARVLSRRGLILEGIRVKRARQDFFIGQQRHINRGDPAWRWNRLERLPVTIGAHQPITVVSRLRLKRGVTVGRVVGVEIVLAGDGKRTAVRLKRAALVCRSQCSQGERDRAWDAASAIGS